MSISFDCAQIISLRARLGLVKREERKRLDKGRERRVVDRRKNAERGRKRDVWLWGELRT